MKLLVIVSGGVVNNVLVHGRATSPADVECIVHDYDELEASEGLHEDGTTMDESQFDALRWYADGQSVAEFLEQVQFANPNYREVF